MKTTLVKRTTAKGELTLTREGTSPFVDAYLNGKYIVDDSVAYPMPEQLKDKVGTEFTHLFGRKVALTAVEALLVNADPRSEEEKLRQDMKDAMQDSADLLSSLSGNYTRAYQQAMDRHAELIARYKEKFGK